MFMMQLCQGARHLEVQIVGDEHGNAVALNGRDCSTQRRFQKIFEEGPPIVAKPETFKAMERAAQRLTQSIGYTGAGTVEYLYNEERDEFYFLELNPRLQVSRESFAAPRLPFACSALKTPERLSPWLSRLVCALLWPCGGGGGCCLRWSTR
jgi:carbamoylphosphate synthase large subunit